MKITIVGCGVVGMATGKGFMTHGHEVHFYDVNEKVMSKLRGEGLNTGLYPSDIYFICTNERDVENAVKMLLDFDGLIVVRSSTLPKTVYRLMKKYDRHICHNPEFLRTKYALDDFLHPSRVVIGECCKKHGDDLEKLYEPFNSIIIRTTPTNSELVKLACNAFLSTLISFWNEIDLIAEKFGADPKVIRKIAVLDERIPRYGAVRSGRFGGTCLPKDLINFISACQKANYNPKNLKAVKEVNEAIL